MIVPGTCGACRHYQDCQCQRSGSPFAGRSLWALACLGCHGYERSGVAATPVPPEALAAVLRNT
ncbi:protein of unknown function [Magnetospirillum sp. XM-1]|uniref:cytochrome c n=1 Tax=Magnetospirillum sp. XM-1 TaxID=1663591 RepID=UPI00073DE04E|nr:cytochrome c [Magnetospirillum sp. XM-1]CUW41695.1 protein of unknown function [Magnetospirillum sp. XM-1]